MRSLSFLTAACIVMFTAPLLAQTDDCLSHFQESGSIFKGKVLETYAELSGIDKTTALHRLQGQLQLPSAGFLIISVDAEAGTIKGENQDPHSRPFPVEFTISPTPSGVRVRLWLKMKAGQMAGGGFKSAICDMLRLAAVEPPPAAQPESANPRTSGAAADTQASAPAEGDDIDKPLTADDIAKHTSAAPSDDQPRDKEAGSAHKKKEQKALTNEDVIAMVKAELGDKVVIDKIRSSPGDKLDTSTEALIRLKKAGVSRAVINAIVKRGDE